MNIGDLQSLVEQRRSMPWLRRQPGVSTDDDPRLRSLGSVGR